jgi:3-deoxy-manno-octulosonate cytidylyltransferase (CMP-KDO synthetase)
MTAFTVVIPARLASSRLERKALADLGGKSMVVRVAERAAQSKAQQVVVATDALEIESVCKAAGFSVVMTRSEHPSGTDRIAEVVSTLGLDDNALIVNVQGDEPLIPIELINEVAHTLDSHPDCAMSTAAVAIHDDAEVSNPNAVKVVLNQRGEAMYFSRSVIPFDRTHTNPAYYRHIGIYGYRTGFLKRYAQLAPSPLELAESLEQLRVLWHGERIAVHITAVTPPAGVDTPEDLARVRALF